MANLEVIVHSINSFVVTISNISDQTNLLALNLQFKRLELGNASCGVFVVADEVGSLAINTSRSAEEVGGLIARIKQIPRQALNLPQHLKNQMLNYLIPLLA